MLCHFSLQSLVAFTCWMVFFPQGHALSLTMSGSSGAPQVPELKEEPGPSQSSGFESRGGRGKFWFSEV